MLTCQEVTAKASLMVDGELGFRERIAMRMHLMMCANCRRFARQFKALVSSMASRNRLESEAISPEFVDRVCDRLTTLDKSSSSPPGPDSE